MKSIKKLLAVVMAIALIATYFVFPASATNSFSSILDFKDGGFAIDLRRSIFDETTDVEKVTFLEKELTKNTDYTVEKIGDDVFVIFTDSFMKTALYKDIEDEDTGCNFKVYYDGGIDIPYFGGNAYQTYNEGIFYYSKLKSDFDKDKPLYELLVEKGFFKYDANTDTYYFDDEAAFVLNGNYVSPGNHNVFDIFNMNLTIEDACKLKKENWTDIYWYGDISFGIGNQGILDLSNYETKTKLDSNFGQPLSLILMGLNNKSLWFDTSAFGSGDPITVYNITKDKVLFILEIEDDEYYVTLGPDVTAADNIFENEIDLTSLPCPAVAGDKLTASLIFVGPTIKSGDNSTWDSDKKGNLTITSTASYEKEFIKACVDGKKLVKDVDYTVKEGSTEITLLESFLKTLSAGEHKLDIVSISGTATAKFTVTAPKVTPTPEEKKTEEKTTETKTAEPEAVADTADTNAIAVFAALTALSAAGFVTVKKKEN